MSADPQGDTISDFVTIAQVLDLPEKDEPDQALVIAAIKRWLQNHERWLLLFDNVEDVAAVNALIPETGKGHILITTRSQATGSIAIPHEIEPWDAQVGAEFLLRRAKIMPKDAPPEYLDSLEDNSAQEISRHLGGLPLALDQAGAYIEETKRNLSDYLDLYQKRRAALLSRRGKFSADHPDSVATTLSLAFEDVERVHPEAAELLRFCAFLHPDAIPEEIIVEGAANFSPDFQVIASDPFLLDEAIEALLEFSLVRRNPSTRTISIHRLVQDVLRDGMSQEQQHQWAEHAIQAVSHTFPDGEPSTWPRCQRYLPHARVCVHLIEQWDMHFDEAVQLLINVGYYLYNRAQYPEAEHLYTQALELLKQEDESLARAQILNNMGDLYLALGQYTRAEQYFRQALNIRERLLEHTHPGIGQSLNDLAGAYHYQKKYAEAETFYLQALAIREQALGLEHPGTAETLNNLGLLYSDQGKYAEAESLHLRALAIREKVLGPDHVDTSYIIHNLARNYHLQKKYSESEKLFMRALVIREEVFGPEHPRTAITLNRLGLLYYLQEKDAEAELLLRRALQVWEKTLGPEHPELVDFLDPLAVIYERQEKYAEAELLYLKIIAIQKRMLGPEHPEVATVLDKYASLLHKMGKEAEAIVYANAADAIRSKHTEQENAY
jgi:tetratricopeptide (TPR) repeat protein